MKTNREIAYRVNPAPWMQAVLGITPHDWQRKFLLAPLGASIAVLTARQVGKTTAAAVGMAPVPRKTKAPRCCAKSERWC
jgi:hypothetical protein